MDKRVEAALRAEDVPQSDSLPTIRVILEHLAAHGGHVATISERSGVSERHVRYRLQAAKVLGWVADDRMITPRGRALLRTKVGSRQEREAFRAAVGTCAVVSTLLPSSVSAQHVDVDDLAKKISSVAGLSFDTAHRRARVLRSWLRQVGEGDRESK